MKKLTMIEKRAKPKFKSNGKNIDDYDVIFHRFTKLVEYDRAAGCNIFVK